MGHYSAVSRDCSAFHVPLECDLATEGTESTEKLKGDQLIEQIIAVAIEVHRLPCPGLLESICEEVAIIELKSLSRVPEVSKARRLSYLKATRLKRAVLINDGEKSVYRSNHKIISVISVASVAKRGVLSQESIKFHNYKSHHQKVR